MLNNAVYSFSSFPFIFGVVLFTLSSGCSRVIVPRIDAVGFGGGDPLESKITQSRFDLIDSLKQIRSEATVDSLCRSNSCPGDSTICDQMRSLNRYPKKRTQVVDYLLNSEVLTQLESIVAQTGFEIQDSPLIFQGNEVDAISGEKVRFNRSRNESKTMRELEALWTHEIIHLFANVSDQAPNGSFDAGSQFLDAIGACVAAFGQEENGETIKPLVTGYSDFTTAALEETVDAVDGSDFSELDPVNEVSGFRILAMGDIAAPASYLAAICGSSNNRVVRHLEGSDSAVLYAQGNVMKLRTQANIVIPGRRGITLNVEVHHLSGEVLLNETVGYLGAAGEAGFASEISKEFMIPIIADQFYQVRYSTIISTADDGNCAGATNPTQRIDILTLKSQIEVLRR